MNKQNDKYEIDIIYYCRECNTVDYCNTRQLKKYLKCKKCGSIYYHRHIACAGRTLQRRVNTIIYPMRYKLKLYTRFELNLDLDTVSASDEFYFFETSVKYYYAPYIYRSDHNFQYAAFTIEDNKNGKIAVVEDGYNHKDCLVFRHHHVFNFSYFKDNAFNLHLCDFNFNGIKLKMYNILELIRLIEVINERNKYLGISTNFVFKYILK
ncbi:hypothetical protein AVBRAN12640_09075 [Campylobacter sp. RM12640]|uniref:hypothetical protein n=1 Tax=unclassified Campylobacter TaxID=2593542 RepID=UPI00301526C0|nr:hypothetical protein [Campylobacter sp. RM12640]MBZ7989951.1 hypothetical protein [Campylobacter sp. RM12635]